jgi:hypothetical protein
LGHQQTHRMELSLIHPLEAERGTWVSLPLQITCKDLTEAEIWFMLKVKQHFCCFCRRYMHMGLNLGLKSLLPFHLQTTLEWEWETVCHFAAETYKLFVLRTMISLDFVASTCNTAPQLALTQILTPSKYMLDWHRW